MHHSGEVSFNREFTPYWGFPGSSAGKESASCAGDPGSIPGLGRYPGEGKGYPLQYSGLENSKDCIVHGSQRVGHERLSLSLSPYRASLVALTVKNLPIMWQIEVRSLGREDPLEKEMAIHSSIFAWKISWTEELRGLQSMGLQRVGHD